MGLLEQAILQDQKATGAGANTSSEALGAHLDGAKQAQAEFVVTLLVHHCIRFLLFSGCKSTEPWKHKSAGNACACVDTKGHGYRYGAEVAV